MISYVTKKRELPVGKGVAAVAGANGVSRGATDVDIDWQIEVDNTVLTSFDIPGKICTGLAQTTFDPV